QLQQRRLAAAGGADQADDAARLDPQIEPREGVEFGVGVSDLLEGELAAGVSFHGRNLFEIRKLRLHWWYPARLRTPDQGGQESRNLWWCGAAGDNYGPGHRPLRFGHRRAGRHDRHGWRFPDDAAADPDLRHPADD